MNNEMLALTLSEYLTAAGLCLDFKKDGTWPALGRLGFPAALLLFSVIDAIGSYLEGSQEKFLVGGKQRRIQRGGFEHFFVFNGDSYYRQELTHAEIKHIYDEYRSLLVHNAVFTPKGFLAMSASPDVFLREPGKLGVNLTALYNESVAVAARFLENHPDIEQSKVARKILRGAS